MAITKVATFQPVNSTTETTPFDCNGGTYLVAAIGNGENTGNNLGVSYNAVAMTNVLGGNDDFCSVKILTMANPPAGTNTLLGAPAGNCRAMQAMAYTGVLGIRAGSPTGANNNGGSAAGITITIPCQIGDLVLVSYHGQRGEGGVTITGGSSPTKGTFFNYTDEIGIVEAVAASTSVAITITFNPGFNRLVALGFALAPAPTGTTFYLKDAAAAGSNHGSLQQAGTAPVTATIGTGWDITGLAVGQFSLMDYAVERVAGDFSGTSPTAGPNNTLGDCFRSESTLNGSFAAGTWTLAVPVIAVSGAGATARVRAKLYKGANATGSGATEITAGWVNGTTVTNLQTGVAQTSTVTFTGLAAVAMAAEYLFVQLTLETV